MANIKVINEQQFDQALKKEIGKKMQNIILNSDKFLMKQADILRDQFQNSQEFRDLSGKLVGEFGFTPEEVRNLKEILTLLVPGNNRVTTLKVTQSSSKFSAILEWVDFNKLKDHPLAQHDLTRVDSQTGQFKLTETISWVDWLENGAVVRGYNFSEVGGNSPGRAFSRSGKGIMRESKSGFWDFTPTKVFDSIGKKFSEAEFKRGFGVVLRRRGG